MNMGITAIDGVMVGHASDMKCVTGCTVVRFEKKTIGGGFIPGMASGTRGTDLFRSIHLRDEVHAYFLCGGSAFGLDATGGVMKYLEEQGVGFDVQVTKIPRVPSAVIFDLPLGDCVRRPDSAMGYQACANASSGPVEQGSVGVGTGATVGKFYGLNRAMKSGVGSVCLEGPFGRVGALVVVNSFGDVVDYDTGNPIAGLRDERGNQMISTAHEMKTKKMTKAFDFGFREEQNTALAVIAVDATLIKPELNIISLMAQRGLVKTIDPIHTTFDGDVIFAASLGNHKGEVDLNVIGLLAEEALGRAVNNAVRSAKGLAGIPSHHDLHSNDGEG
ncbi:MAG: peptidase S58 family protein [Proteobacteria bacterium]|nr:peptidase S58 family protein [Pseudomonadota bacterium]